MKVLNDLIISEDLYKTYFECNLKACKGECCVSGDSGAPIIDEEKIEIEKYLDQIMPYLSLEQANIIRTEGFSEIDMDGDLVTKCMPDDTRCVFTVKENGITYCGIEKAYREGEISFQKPISCHLFPIRIKEYRSFKAINVQQLTMCNCAFQKGKENQTSVLDFCKDALTRKFGEEIYKQIKDLT